MPAGDGKWTNLAVTYSFVPDGTLMYNGKASQLFAYLARYTTKQWKAEIARALATWAAVTNGLSFTEVADNGDPIGEIGNAQGGPNGDIRIGAYLRGDGYFAWTYYPVNPQTLGGDCMWGTDYTFNIGGGYPDLYSGFLHEMGHALGLAHSYVGPPY